MKLCSMAVFALFFSSFNLLAGDTPLDDALKALIKKHNLRPLRTQKIHNQALYDLGEKLFSDKILSGNKNISCQTCHHPDFGTGDALPLPIGEGGHGDGDQRKLGNGQIVPRNSPAVWNLGDSRITTAFWDGRVEYFPKTHSFKTPEENINGVDPKWPEFRKILTSSLSAQAMFPPTSHTEMRGQVGTNEIANAETNREAWALLTKRVVSVDEYRELLLEAYPRKQSFNFAHIGNALAEFQRVNFQATDTPWDRYLKGDNSAMGNMEKEGAIIFLGRGNCVECHSGDLFTDQKFHNTGFPQIGPGKQADRNDLGRYMISGLQKDLYAFKTPQLRNIVTTAPFGHAGTFKSLAEAIFQYINTAFRLERYSPRFTDLPYQVEVEKNYIQERINTIDPIVGPFGLEISGMDVRPLEAFIGKSLTSN